MSDDNQQPQSEEPLDDEERARRERADKLRETGDYEIVDIYLTHNPIEAQLIEEILEDYDVPVIVRKLEPDMFPMSVGKHGQHRIEVEDFNVERAVALIREAIEEDALNPEEGKFIFDD
jgi:hypothetical protein